MVGSAIVRELQRQGYTNIITRTHKELDLTRQDAVEEFFAQEKGHKQPTTQPSGIYSPPPIKSTPTSLLKAARSRTEESTWAGQTPRRRPLGPGLSGG